MKFRTVLATAVGVGIGYVLGTRAGRGKFDELKAQAQRIATDPDVRSKVADLPHQVRENLPKAQAVVSDAIKTATEKAQSMTSDARTSHAQTADGATTDSVTTTDATTQSGIADVTTDSATTDLTAEHAAQSVVTEPFVEPTVVVETSVTADENKP